MLEHLSKLIIFSALIGYSITDSSSCAEWTAYKNEKCLKVFDSVTTESEAENICKGKASDSVLALIQSNEEQVFVEKYLKTSNIADNVWIGIKKINNSFKALDGTDIKYTNWAKERPLKNSTDHACVEVSVDDTTYGKWMDDKCVKKNAVLCQRTQTWSVEKLQKYLLDTNRELKELKEELTNLVPKSDPVPIGFIYVQMAGESEPKMLWPNIEWENVSAKYSGLFFRTEGKGSGKFGETQEELTRDLQIHEHQCENNYTRDFSSWVTVGTSGFSKYIFTGSGGTNHFGLNFRTNTNEIRPRNQAIRIWKRIK